MDLFKEDRDATSPMESWTMESISIRPGASKEGSRNRNYLRSILAQKSAQISSYDGNGRADTLRLHTSPSRPSSASNSPRGVFATTFASARGRSPAPISSSATPRSRFHTETYLGKIRQRSMSPLNRPIGHDSANIPHARDSFSPGPRHDINTKDRTHCAGKRSTGVAQGRHRPFSNKMKNGRARSPLGATRVPTSDGGLAKQMLQVMGQNTEKNVQKTRINKLKDRVKTLERRMIDVLASAPAPVRMPPVPIEACHNCLDVSEASLERASHGPFWEVMDLILRSTRSVEEETMMKALEQLDALGDDISFQDFQTIMTRFLAEVGVALFPADQGAKLESFCRDIFEDIVAAQKYMAAAEHESFTGQDVECIHIKTLQSRLTEEWISVNERHTKEYLQVELDTCGYIAEGMLNNAVDSRVDLAACSEDQLVTCLDGLEGTLKAALRLSLAEYLKASATSNSTTSSNGASAWFARLGHTDLRFDRHDIKFQSCGKFGIDGIGSNSERAYACPRNLLARAIGLSLSLEQFVGLPALPDKRSSDGGDLWKQMAREHESDAEFMDPTHLLTTTPKQEWDFLYTDRKEPVDDGSRIWASLETLMHRPEAIEAGLTIEEIAALRLFGGPMHHLYNEVLRDHFRTRDAYLASLSLIMNSKVDLVRYQKEYGDIGSRYEELKNLLIHAGVDRIGQEGEAEAKYLAALRMELLFIVKSRPVWFQQLERMQRQGAQCDSTRDAEAQAEEMQVLQTLLGMEGLVRAQLGEGRFVTTIHLICAAFAKLSASSRRCQRVQSKGSAWRGLYGQRFPPGLRVVGDKGQRLAVELGFCCASLDPELAVLATGAALPGGATEGCQFPLPTLLRIDMGSCLSAGIQIGWISQYPSELEVAFPPLSVIQVCENSRSLLKIPTTGSRHRLVQVFNLRVRSPENVADALDTDTRAQRLQHDMNEHALQHLSSELNVQLAHVAELSSTTPERLALASMLVDTVKRGARHVLLHPSVNVDRKEICSSALKACQHGEKFGFKVEIEDVISQHGLCVPAAMEAAKQKSQARSEVMMQAKNLRLLEVAEDGQDKECLALLAQNCSPNFATKRGVTALHKACANGHATICKLLLENQALVTAQDCHGRAPFDYAFRHQHLDLLSLLVAKGSSADVAMFSAMENSDVAAVQTLLSVVPAAVHCVSSQRQTPLSLAVNNSHEELVSILLSHNADVNAFVGDGKQQGGGTQTSLCKAVQKGHIGIVQALLDAGADPTKSHTVSGRSPLHMACWLGLIEVVQALLTTARERGFLRPPALSNKEPVYLLAVLFFLMPVDLVMAKDKEGNLPLHSCVLGGHLEILKVLLLSCLEGGYVVSARNGEGCSALFVACRAASEALPSESIQQSIEDCSTTDDPSALQRPREEAMVRRERAIGMALALVHRGAFKAEAREAFPDFDFLQEDESLARESKQG